MTSRTRRRSSILALALALTLLSACGGDGSDAADGAAWPADGGADIGAAADSETPDALPDDTRQETQDSGPDSGPNPGLDIEAGGDAGPDSGPALLEVPIEPPLVDPAEALADEPFAQEWNHRLDAFPGELGPLVAVVLRSPDENGPAVVPVGPAGPWVSDGSGDGAVRQEPLPDGAGEVLDAEAQAGGVLMLTTDALYRWAPDASTEFKGELVGELPEPGAPIRLAASEGGVFVLTTTHLGWLVADGAEPAWLEMSPAPSAVARRGAELLLAWSDTLASFDVDERGLPAGERWRVALDAGTPVALLLDRTVPQTLDLVVVGSERLVGLSLSDEGATEVDVPLFAPERVPLTAPVTARPETAGGFVVAAAGGAYRPVDDARGPEYRVYVPERWLPSGDVRDVVSTGAAEGDALYFATAAGAARVSRTRWTLKQKAAHMGERIVLRHDRDGAVADSRLTAPGDLSTSVPWDSDNDGGWTCYWVLSECFRYRLTGAEDAKANFDRSLARMLSFRTLSGTDYFLARSVIRLEGCQLDDCDGPDDGEWFLSPDGEWWVKADTSNDEVTSHMFMMGHAYDLCADPEQQAAIVAHVDGIIGGIVDNGYQLVDPQDGEPTSYGQFDPFYVNVWPGGSMGDGGRRSVQLLGALNLAHYLTGDPRYLEAKRELIEDHHYDENVANVGDPTVYPACAGSGDCDELAFQAFVPLLRYETDPALRERWLTGWRQLYAQLALQEDALWDIANAVLDDEANDDRELPGALASAAQWLRRYPTDLVRWPVHNDVRQDSVDPPPYYTTQKPRPNYRLRSDGHIFPPDERPNARHNTPQFEFAGGWGALREMDGGDALFPYWLARYYGLFAAP